MNAADELEKKIRRHPRLAYERLGDHIRIPAPNDRGFPITFDQHQDGWLVSFGDGGMHEHFEAADEALEFVAFGLSTACRLRVVRTLFLHRSYVEKRNASSWASVMEVGVLCFPLTITPKESLFQNDLIVIDESENSGDHVG